MNPGRRRTFSRISRALLHSGSASLYFPLLPYSTARLFRVAATCNGWREGERSRRAQGVRDRVPPEAREHRATPGATITQSASRVLISSKSHWEPQAPLRPVCQRSRLAQRTPICRREFTPSVRFGSGSRTTACAPCGRDKCVPVPAERGPTCAI